MMTSIDSEILRVLRDSLREKGKRQILTDDEYLALLNVNAKIGWPPVTKK